MAHAKHYTTNPVTRFCTEREFHRSAHTEKKKKNALLSFCFALPPLLMEINAVNQTNTPTFYSKTQQNPLMGSALHEAFPTFQTTRGTTRKRTVYLKSQNKDSLREEEEEEEEDDDDDDDERIEVKRKIVALQRIVPGGEALGVDKLFEETAGYILTLQGQIRAMRVLTSFIEGMDKQKRKLGD
ncbi:hypothetical protein ES332_A11G071100v1 [Gossypium tomentosum]|uniref:BHLH domain-containing protein n=1 Tax=Gossypium tomentosum TaxID=34277 RepID=A0A5D2NAA3_GOSTO|nr:hypothetical protein ES332_A11G071100v1 [Gossypium tomentosum]